MPKQAEKPVEILTIEEAEKLGLTQVVKQLRINDLARKGLGLQTLDEAINDKTPKTAGRKKKITHTPAIAMSKLIRTNFNDLA